MPKRHRICRKLRAVVRIPRPSRTHRIHSIARRIDDVTFVLDFHIMRPLRQHRRRAQQKGFVVTPSQQTPSQALALINLHRLSINPRRRHSHPPRNIKRQQSAGSLPRPRSRHHDLNLCRGLQLQIGVQRRPNRKVTHLKIQLRCRLPPLPSLSGGKAGPDVVVRSVVPKRHLPHRHLVPCLRIKDHIEVPKPRLRQRREEQPLFRCNRSRNVLDQPCFEAPRQAPQSGRPLPGHHRPHLCGWLQLPFGDHCFNFRPCPVRKQQQRAFKVLVQRRRLRIVSQSCPLAGVRRRQQQLPVSLLGICAEKSS